MGAGDCPSPLLKSRCPLKNNPETLGAAPGGGDCPPSLCLPWTVCEEGKNMVWERRWSPLRQLCRPDGSIPEGLLRRWHFRGARCPPMTSDLSAYTRANHNPLPFLHTNRTLPQSHKPLLPP